jgi:hypothetical protein
MRRSLRVQQDGDPGGPVEALLITILVLVPAAPTTTRRKP